MSQSAETNFEKAVRIENYKNPELGVKLLELVRIYDQKQDTAIDVPKAVNNHLKEYLESVKKTDALYQPHNDATVGNRLAKAAGADVAASVIKLRNPVAAILGSSSSFVKAVGEETAGAAFNYVYDQTHLGVVSDAFRTSVAIREEASSLLRSAAGKAQRYFAENARFKSDWKKLFPGVAPDMTDQEFYLNYGTLQAEQNKQELEKEIAAARGDEKKNFQVLSKAITDLASKTSFQSASAIICQQRLEAYKSSLDAIGQYANLIQDPGLRQGVDWMLSFGKIGLRVEQYDADRAELSERITDPKALETAEHYQDIAVTADVVGYAYHFVYNFVAMASNVHEDTVEDERFKAVMAALAQIQKQLEELDHFVRSNAEYVDTKLNRILTSVEALAKEAQWNHAMLSAQVGALQADIQDFQTRVAKWRLQNERKQVVSDDEKLRFELYSAETAKDVSAMRTAIRNSLMAYGFLGSPFAVATQNRLVNAAAQSPRDRVIELTTRNYLELGYEIESYLLQTVNAKPTDGAAGLDVGAWLYYAQRCVDLIDNNRRVIERDPKLSQLAENQLSEFVNSGSRYIQHLTTLKQSQPNLLTVSLNNYESEIGNFFSIAASMKQGLLAMNNSSIALDAPIDQLLNQADTLPQFEWGVVSGLSFGIDKKRGIVPTPLPKLTQIPAAVWHQVPAALKLALHNGLITDPKAYYFVLDGFWQPQLWQNKSTLKDLDGKQVQFRGSGWRFLWIISGKFHDREVALHISYGDCNVVPSSALVIPEMFTFEFPAALSTSKDQKELVRAGSTLNKAVMEETTYLTLSKDNRGIGRFGSPPRATIFDKEFYLSEKPPLNSDDDVQFSKGMRELANDRTFEPLFRLLVDSSEWQRATYLSDIRDSALKAFLRKQRSNYVDKLRLTFLESHGAENNLRSVYRLLLLSKAIELFFPNFDDKRIDVAFLSFASVLGLPTLETLIDEYERGGMSLDQLKVETHKSTEAARSVLANLSQDRYKAPVLMAAVMQKLVRMQESLQHRRRNPANAPNAKYGNDALSAAPSNRVVSSTERIPNLAISPFSFSRFDNDVVEAVVTRGAQRTSIWIGQGAAEGTSVSGGKIRKWPL